MTDKSSSNLRGSKEIHKESRYADCCFSDMYQNMVSVRVSSDTSKTAGSKRKHLRKFVHKCPTLSKDLVESLKELLVSVKSELVVVLNFTKMVDRVGAWTPSGGQTKSNASRGTSWFTDRGYGTLDKPVPDTPLARKLGIAGCNRP